MAKDIVFKLVLDGSQVAVNNLTDVKLAITEINKKLKETTDQTAYDELSQDLIQLKAIQQQFNEEQRRAVASVRALSTGDGSYRQLSNELANLRASYKELSQAEREGAIGQETQKNIQALDVKLKDIDAGIGQFQRNVGDYQRSIALALAEFGTQNQIENAIKDLQLETEKLVLENKELSASYVKLTTEANTKLDSLQQELKNLESATQKDVVAIENLKQEIIKFSNVSGKQIQEVANKMNGLKDEINKNERALNQIGQKLDNGFGGLQSTLSQIFPAFGQLNEGLNDISQNASSAGKVITGVFAGFLVANEIADQLSVVKDALLDISDLQADIRKTAGLTQQEVVSLTEKLKGIDTRTSLEELLKIGVIGGQLGIQGEEGVLRFTSAIDKLNVALGDEFQGGAEEITNNVGRLSNVFFGVTSDANVLESNLLNLGNSLNDLASKGSATAPVLVDFASRIAPVGKQLGLTNGQILGISATLQELNISAEVGGTAVGKILGGLTSDYKQFEKVLGINAKVLKENGIGYSSYADFIKNDLSGALAFTGKLINEQVDSNISLSQTLAQLGINGEREKLVFASLGQAQQRLAENTKTATEALQNQDSINKEVSIKNENLAAQYEKLANRIKEAFISDQASSFFSLLIQGANSLIDIFGSLFNFFTQSTLALGLFLASLVATTVQMVINTSATEVNTLAKIKNFAISVKQRIEMLLYNATLIAQTIATQGLSGAITILTTGMRTFFAVLVANPFGAIAAGLALVGAGIALLVKKTSELTLQQQTQLDIQKEQSRIGASEITRISLLINLINNQNLSYEQRNNALKEAQKINPEYFKDLSLEADAIQKNTDLLKGYIAIIRKKSEAQAIANLLTKVEQDIQEVTVKGQDEFLTFFDKIGRAAEGGFGLSKNFKDNLNKSLSEDAEEFRKKELDALKKRREELEKQIKPETAEAIIGTTGTGVAGLETGDGKKKKKGKTDAQKQAEKDAEDELKRRADLNKKIEDLIKKEDETEQKLNEQFKQAQNKQKADDLKERLAQLRSESLVNIDQINKDYEAEKQARDELRLELLNEYENEFKQRKKTREDLIKKYGIASDEVKKYDDATKELAKSYQSRNTVITAFDERTGKELLDIQKNTNNLIAQENEQFRQKSLDERIKFEKDRIKTVIDGALEEDKLTKVIRENQIKEVESKIAKGVKGLEKTKIKLEIELAQDELSKVDKAIETIKGEIQKIENSKLTASTDSILVLSDEELKAQEDNLQSLNDKLADLLSKQADLNNQIRTNTKTGLEQFSSDAKLFFDTYVNDSANSLLQVADLFLQLEDQKQQKLLETLNAEQEASNQRLELLKASQEKAFGLEKLILKQKIDNELKEQKRIEEEKLKIEKEQARKRKAIALAEATINLAGAIIKVIDKPFLIPFVATAGALQIANIVAQEFADGGKVTDLTNSNGVITEQPNIKPTAKGDNILAYVKKGEAILNEKQQRLIGYETLRNIGVPGFANGGIIGTLKNIPNLPPQVYSSVSTTNSDLLLNLTAKLSENILSLQDRVDNINVVLNVNELNDAQTNINELKTNFEI